MGEMLTLRIIQQDRERSIKIRENLTINNLKAIMNSGMKLERKNIKIILEGYEQMGHMRLTDLGLKDGMSLRMSLEHQQKTEVITAK